MFNPWFSGGNGNCFTALGLSPADVPTFQSFGALCSAAVGGGGGQCPTTTCSNGRTVEDRFVLVDQHMTFTQAQQYCQSRYHDLASIHSKDEQDLAISKCAQRTNPNTCVDRWVDETTCCATAGCLPGNNQQSDGVNGCWIGLHQPFGHGEREVVAFDNTQQCNVDQRLPGHLLDIEITHIRVQRVDGQTHEWDFPETTLRSLLLGPWQ